MYTLFLSDLHLDPQQPQIGRAFAQLLRNSRDAEALYILGDFVEYWIGDDDDGHGLDEVFEDLRRFTADGVPVWLMHGNRDFLIGRDFANRCGVRLLNDPHIIGLYGKPTLLMHGDLLCSDDVAYQSFRTTVRDPRWQADFLAKSPDERRAIVRNLRETSRQATGSKSEYIMDVNQKTVEQFMHEYRVARLVHGHTHRPAMHSFMLDNKNCQRWVLSDWQTEAKILRCDAGGCAFETLSIEGG